MGPSVAATLRSSIAGACLLAMLGAPTLAVAKRPPCPIPKDGFTRESYLREMSSRDPIGRWCAAEKLRDFKGPRVARAFIVALDDDSGYVRLESLAGLKSHPGRAVLKELVKKLDPTGRPSAKDGPKAADYTQALIETALVVEPTRARDALITAARPLLDAAKQQRTRLAGLRTLEVLDAKESIGLISPLTRDEDAVISKRARTILKAWGQR